MVATNDQTERIVMRTATPFVKSTGTVKCAVPGGKTIRIPVFPGVLKHPTLAQLRCLLRDPDVAQKYTVEALRIAPWPVLREFPHEWLKQCMPQAHLDTRRSRALKFLLA